MKLSVILCCLNEVNVIHFQLDALARQKWDKPWELVVADNGSTDGTQDVVMSYSDRIPNLRIVDASDRKGLAHARNVGAAAALGESIAYCDADDEISDNWVALMGEAVAEKDFVACRVDFEKLNPAWILASRQSTQYHGLQPYTYPRFLDHAGGSTIAIKKHIHDSVGGFDENILILEDTDYCWRVQLAGTKLHFVPEAVLYVRLRPNMRAMCRQSRKWAEYNVLLYKRYRERGMPKIGWKSGIGNWVRLMRQIPTLFDAKRRAQWLWEVNWAYGRLIGSFKHRTYAL